MKAWISLALAAAGLGLAACASAPPPAPLLHPYKVVLLPIEGSKAALAAQPGSDDVALALTPEKLDAAITRQIVQSHVFSSVLAADAGTLGAASTDDRIRAAADFARSTSSDLILRIEVKSARMTDLGNNGSTFWSTLTWFMIPAPTWFVNDRTYDTNISVQAELYDPADPVKPTASVVASSGKQELDLWDRGLSPFVFVVPPPFLKGSDSSVSETLTERATEQLLTALVEELRTREIPSRFELDVVEDGAGVKITVGSRRRLRSLDVSAAGKSLGSWAETALVEEKDSTPERFVYRRVVEARAGAGAAIRVVAEDEAGGREVRTLVLGRKEVRSAAICGAVLAAAAAVASAKPAGDATGIVLRFPSGDAPDIPTLRTKMADPAVSAVVFEKGTYQLVIPDPADPQHKTIPTTLFAFRHSNLTLCGATGRADDVVLVTSATTTLLVEQSNGTVIRDLTLRSTAAGGTALRVNAVFSADVESFADDTTVTGCAFEAFVGVQASVRTRNLSISRSRLTVTQPGGAGVVWEDGSGLFLTKNRFTTDVVPPPGVTPTATAAVLVRGPFLSSSEGDRARHLLFTKNVVSGDFATGFDLADVTDLRLSGNRVDFPGPQYVDVAADPDAARGRVGITVRRALASALTEDYELVGNQVHRAQYALWLLNAGQGVVFANDFTNCGAATSDLRFSDTGAAMRVNLQSGICNIRIEKNDFRRVRSPASPSNPAVVVLPEGSEGACFDATDGNRWDKNRTLYLGAAKR